jgi:hypothetical protein
MGKVVVAAQQAVVGLFGAVGEIGMSAQALAGAGTALARAAKGRAVAYEQSALDDGLDVAVLTRRINLAKRYMELTSEAEVLFGISEPEDLNKLSVKELAARFKPVASNRDDDGMKII